MDELQFSNIYKKWSNIENQNLITDYNSGKDIIEIAEKNKRLPVGIAKKLVSLNIIDNIKNAKGYNTYRNSNYYKNYLISNVKKSIDEKMKLINSKTKDTNIIITSDEIKNKNHKADDLVDYYVYTDGACSNNGKNNAIAGIGIFFGINDTRNISKKIKGKQTNNTAELSAFIETFHIIKNDIENGKRIVIVSDSIYSIRCVTSYGKKCFKKNWNIKIPNKELVKTAYELYKDKTNVSFMYIKAHTDNKDIHSFGNNEADKLANIAIDLKSCPYNIKNKIYLIVPFVKKNEIKNLGGIWDIKNKKWFIYDTNENLDKIFTLFEKE